MKPIQNLAITIIGCLLSMGLFAQDKSTNYYAIDYMKVEPSDISDYLACEQAWKKIHTYKMEQGAIEGWAIERVMSPNGSSEEYNFVTRQRFKNLNQLAAYQSEPYFPDNWKELLTIEEINLVQRTNELRSWVKGEVWSSEELVLDENMDEAEFNVFNFFKMPEGVTRAEHMEMERSLWKPFHKSQVDKGNRKGWVMLNRELPMGGNYDYDVATVDIFKDMNQFWAPMDRAGFEAIHPGKSWEEIWAATVAVSNRGRAELRRSIDSISRGATNTPTSSLQND